MGVSYGSLRALHDVSLEWEPARVHALVGQNGAGKTTLARVLAGLVTPDSGRVAVGGREITAGDVAGARSAGLSMVHQHFSLPPSFTVAEALELTAPKAGGRSLYRRSDLERRWLDQVSGVAGASSPSVRVRDLPVEARQSLEIVRALATEVRVLVLDEPTALLTPTAIDELFERLGKLRDEGVTVLIVLHKLAEVMAVADTVSVLRGGRLVLGPTEVGRVGQGELSDAMVGAEGAAGPSAPVARPPVRADRTALLELGGVTTSATAAEHPLDGVDLELGAGEILGVAGVEGNGQRGLVSAIAGLTRVTAGTVRIGGRDVTRAGAATRRRLGLRLVPFDRTTEGISRSASLWANQSALRLVERRRRRSIPVVSIRRFKEAARRALDRWGVQYQTVVQPAASLSGGNVQRLILSRELTGDLEVLVAAQPTRGLDFAATDFVRRTLEDLRDSGVGVLLVSSDLDELFGLSDRLAVMLGGRMVAAFTPPYDRRAVGDAMIGAER